VPNWIVPLISLIALLGFIGSALCPFDTKAAPSGK